MNVRTILKCEVCDTLTLLRTQAGWLSQHPIKFNCGNCEITISGTVYFDQKNATVDFEFTNAEMISNEDDIEYQIKASGELLTSKLQKHAQKNPEFIPPFFEVLSAMGKDDFQDFKQRTIKFIHSIEDWPKIKRINELWLKGNYDYLKNEVNYFLSEKKYPLSNQLEQLMAVHHLTLKFFNPIMNKKRFQDNSGFILNQINKFSKENIDLLIELVQYFKQNNLIKRFENKLFRLCNQFVKKFKFIIPAFSLNFYKEVKSSIYKNKGISTASFEDFKELYLDYYEVLGDISILLISFNNLLYRKDFNDVEDKRSDIKSIDDLRNKSKGIKLNFLNNKEKYSNLLSNEMDNNIRNAIGHNSFKFDTFTQLITFYPKGEDNKDRIEEVYLAEFAFKCLKLFWTLIDLYELLYQTQKVYLLTQGNFPTFDLEEFINE